jgi:Fe-S-cluster-containing dehydrogenase component
MKVEERKLVVRKMVLHPEKCSGCMLCLMACSLKYEGVVNPLKARSRVIRDGEVVTKILLSPECTFCGHCCSVCLYGARILKEVS